MVFFRVDVTNVWGHMNLFAKGAGQAVAQLDLTYGVDYEPYKVKPDPNGQNLSVFLYKPLNRTCLKIFIKNHVLLEMVTVVFLK
jgi:hypothetical protein